jgi:hypothetical protein
MRVSWARLAERTERVHPDVITPGRGGAAAVELALETLLGPDGIRSAVETVLERRPGADVAESVLVHLASAEAARLAYAIYREASGQRAADAASLVKQIAHPLALARVEEFLASPDAAGWGIALLDQFLWRGRVAPDDPEVERLLRLAEAHPWPTVRDNAAFVRQYLYERDAPGHEP